MFKYLIVILLCETISVYSQDSQQEDFTSFPLTYVGNLTRRHGYPMEKHETTTNDGYILTMYLMPQKGAGRLNSKTVFLSHGLLSSSDCWFMNDPETILPFKLYDEGYNVMLGNFRGTSHSMRHVHLAPTSAQFWDWSWDEIGRLDVSAMIDYTLQILKQKKLFLIGHSMGTTTAFVLLSERPEYNEKLYRFIALAPSIFEFSSFHPVRLWLAPFLFYPRIHRAFVQTIVPNGIFPPAIPRINKWRLDCLNAATEAVNSNSSISQDHQRLDNMCRRILSSFGIDSHKIGPEGYHTVLSVPIEASSVRTALHYVQNMRSRYFRKYDHGVNENLKKYGSRLPPDYDLEKVTCPTSLYWAPGDEFATSLDVETLVEKLPKKKTLELFEIKVKPWNHFEYIFSKSAANYLNPHLFQSLNRTKSL